MKTDLKEPTSIPVKLAVWLWQQIPAGRPQAAQVEAEYARIAARDQQVRELLTQIRPPKEFIVPRIARSGFTSLVRPTVA